MHRTWFAPLAALALCLCANAQEDVADVEFKNRAALHAAAPAVGTVVPDLVLVSLEGRPVALTSLRGQTVVLIRAGYMSQTFRDAIKSLTELHQRYADSDDVELLVVVDTEPLAKVNPQDRTEQHLTLAERCALVELMSNEFEVTMPIHVDGVDGASRALCSDLPSPALLIDANGRIADRLPWTDPKPLRNAIARLVRDEKPIVAPNYFEGGPLEREGMYRRATRCEDKVLRAAWEIDALALHEDFDKDAKSAAIRALARVALCGSRSRSSCLRSTWEAETEAQFAWKGDPLRLLAAQAELAFARERAGWISTWRKSLAELRADVDPRIRAWFEAQRVRAERPLDPFAVEARELVLKRLENRTDPPQNKWMIPSGKELLSLVFVGFPVQLARVRFDERSAFVVADVPALGLSKGNVVMVMPEQSRAEFPAAGSERWACLERGNTPVGWLDPAVVAIAER